MMPQRLKIALPAMAVLTALAYLVVMWAVGAPPVRTHLIKYATKGVLTVDPKTITRVETIRQGRKVTYEKRNGVWMDAGSGSALPESQAKALALAVRFMATANPVRVLGPQDVSPAAKREFGLARPTLTVKLATPIHAALTAHFGSLSTDGFLHYMSVDGRPEYFLMSRFVLHEWQKVGQAKP